MEIELVMIVLGKGSRQVPTDASEYIPTLQEWYDANKALCKTNIPVWGALSTLTDGADVSSGPAEGVSKIIEHTVTEDQLAKHGYVVGAHVERKSKKSPTIYKIVSIKQETVKLAWESGSQPSEELTKFGVSTDELFHTRSLRAT